MEPVYGLSSYMKLEIDDTEKPHDDDPLADFTQYIGRVLNVKIRPETDDQRNGKLEASVVGDTTGEAKFDILKLPEDNFIVKFNPKQPDRYTVTIKLNDQDVPRTPFVVSYVVSKIGPSKCKLIGKDEISHPTEVGKEITLLVDARYAGPGQLNVMFQEPMETHNPSVLNICQRPGEKFEYKVSYTPNSHGYHHLNFTWAGELIPDSPIDLLVVDTENAELFYYGKPVAAEFKINGKDLKLKIIHKDTGSIDKGKLTKVQNGKYKISFNPKVPGLYFLHIYTKDKEILSSPYVIKYGRPSKPKECEVVGLEETSFLGEEMSFIVDTKEAGDGKLQVTATGPHKKAKGEVSTVDNKDGTHSVSFYPECAGDYKINILWSEKAIPGCPYPVKVSDVSREQLITKLYLMNRVQKRKLIEIPSSEHVLKTTTDQTIILTIKTRTDEQKNGKFIATATKNDTGENVSIRTIMEGNTFRVLFLPHAPGVYTIGAQLNGEQISGTPIYVVYSTAPPVASQCKIIGLQDHPLTFQVDKNILFQVDTRMAGDGKISIRGESPRGNPRLEVKSSSLSKRIIDVIYIPNALGTHKVKVAWSGEEIPKSPLYFEVEPISFYPNGKPIALDLDVDAKESSLHCLVFQEESGKRLKAKINKLDKRRYSFAFKPRVPGLYSINVYVKMREIKNSPFYVRYSSPPNPEAVVVCNVPAEAYIQESYMFTVDAKDAGMSQLKVKVSPPKRGKDGVVTVTDHKDGIYTVEHVPEVLGNHTFSLVWEKKKIPDSPVTVKVTKRVLSIKTNLGSYTNIVPVGQKISINVDNVGMHEGEHFLRAAVKSMKSGSKDAPVIEREPEKCTVNFTPTLADDYILNLFLHEKGVEGSPFFVKAVNKETLLPSFERTVDNLPSDVECGKPACLIVPRNDSFTHDNTVISVLGPEGPCQMDTNNQLESSQSFNFIPTVTGDYLVSITKDGSNIADSPYKIHAAEKQSDSLKVFMTPTSLSRISDPIPVGMTEEYDIDTCVAGYGKLEVCQKGEGKGTMALRDKGDGIYSLGITPTSEGSCEVDILMNEKSIKGSPFVLQFIYTLPRAEKCFLEDVTDSVIVNTPITFTVNAVEAGSGELGLNVNILADKPAKEKPIFRCTENKDKIFEVEFTPNISGCHVFDVKWSDQSIPGSPFTIPVVEDFLDDLLDSHPSDLPVKELIPANAQTTEETLPPVKQPSELISETKVEKQLARDDLPDIRLPLSSDMELEEGPDMLSTTSMDDECREIQPQLRGD